MDSTLGATLLASPVRLEPGFEPINETRVIPAPPPDLALPPPLPDLFIPELFQDDMTTVQHFDHHMPPPADVPDIHETQAGRETVATEERMDDGVIPRTISFELNQMMERRVERAEARERLAARRRHLLVDLNTKLTDAEMLRHIHLPPRNAADADRERAENNIDELFSKSEHWYRTKNDFLFIDPTTLALNRFAKRQRVYAPIELEQSQHYKILRANRNLVSNKLGDEAKKDREARRAASAVPDLSAIVIQPPTPVETERARRQVGEGTSGAGLLAAEKSIKRTSVLRGSMMGEGTILPQVDEQQPLAYDHHLTMEQQHDTMPIVPPALNYESFDESRLVEIPSHQPPPVFDDQFMPPPVQEPEAPNTYKNIILDQLRERSPFDLTEVIKTLDPLPASMRTSSKKPRHLFACKMFMQTLILAGRREISVVQERFYGSIMIQEY